MEQLQTKVREVFGVGEFAKYKNDPLIKWKESIKKIVGIAVPMERGLDI